MRVLACLLCLATASAASTEIFPSLRKRKQQQQQQLALAQTGQAPEPEAVGPERPEEKAASEQGTGVPAPLDVGADGYPQLPAVSQMLSSSAGTLKTVNSQAGSLEARVVQAQMQIEAKMAKQKAAFEEKLKIQEESNRVVIQANDNIVVEINNLKLNNTNLKKHAHESGQNNQLMRSELHTLQSHLGGATEFTAKSLSSTDDSKNAVLEVLQNPRVHHKSLMQTSSKSSHDADDDSDDEDDDEDSSDDSNEQSKEGTDGKDDDKDDDDSEDEETTSLLSVSKKVHRVSKSADAAASFETAMSELESAVPAAAPLTADVGSNAESLLEGLSREVARLANQEKQSEKTLKDLFIRDFRAGAKRKAALLASQKALLATRSSLRKLQDKLKTADAHLQDTSKHLQSRLHGLGQFLQKMVHLALAPTQEAPHLLKALPQHVTFNGEK